MPSAHFLGIHYNRKGSGKEKGGRVWNTTIVLDFHACGVKTSSCPPPFPPPAQFSFSTLIRTLPLRPVANTRALAVKRRSDQQVRSTLASRLRCQTELTPYLQPQLLKNWNRHDYCVTLFICMIILSTVNIYTNMSSGSQWFPTAKRRWREERNKNTQNYSLFGLLRGVRLLSTDKMNVTWWTVTRTDGKTTRFKSGNSPSRYAVSEPTETAVDTGSSASERVNASEQRYQPITLKVMKNTHSFAFSGPTVCTESTCLSKPYIPLNQELDKSPRPGCHGTHCFPKWANYFQFTSLSAISKIHAQRLRNRTAHLWQRTSVIKKCLLAVICGDRMYVTHGRWGDNS